MTPIHPVLARVLLLQKILFLERNFYLLRRERDEAALRQNSGRLCIWLRLRRDDVLWGLLEDEWCGYHSTKKACLWGPT